MQYDRWICYEALQKITSRKMELSSWLWINQAFGPVEKSKIEITKVAKENEANPFWGVSRWHQGPVQR